MATTSGGSSSSSSAPTNLTTQNPATADGNGVKIWGAKPRRHPGTDGVADATNTTIDKAYDDGLPAAAPSNLGKLHGQSFINKGGRSVQS